MATNPTESQNISEAESPGYEYKTLMSSLQVSVSKHLLDASFTMVWGNDFYYRIIGYSKDEYEELFDNNPQIYYTYHGYKDELGKITQAVIQAIENGRNTFSIVTRMPVKGGGHIWVRMTGTFTDEYVNGKQVSYTVITDINDLVQMRIDQSITYNNIPGFAAKFVIDEHTGIRLLDANDQFQKFFGTKKSIDSSNEVFRKNLELNAEAIQAQYPHVAAGKPIRFLSHLENREGKTVWMQVSGECIDRVGGAPVYLLIYIDVTDLTDLREMQKKLENQARQLKSALQEAESANRAKSDFLSRMSHDIRTPMNAIVGMTEIAASHLERPEKVQDCLKKIALSSQHLLGLINDVLDMSKIESGQMALRNDTMFLPQVLENVIAIVQPMIKSRGQRFSVRLRNVVHEQFSCDSLRLRQVFINILSNAAKFTPYGGSVTVDVEELAYDQPGRARFCFAFSDTGIGIKQEFIGQIFDAFAREKDGRVDKTEGTGLGLAITAKIVELMGGTIDVQSEWGKGTTFTVCLPLQIESRTQDAWSFPELRVLVADDDMVMCEYTAQMLTECGVHAKWVDSGVHAVSEVVATHQGGKDYDAVIVDWKMPGQDGVETVRKIREQVGGDVPILIVSAYDWSEIEETALAAGANGFLPKPLFRSTLLSGLGRYVLGQEETACVHGGERRYDFSGKTFLLVEDNELNREIAVELLCATGAKVEYACDGGEGVERFMDSPAHGYDLILMDIQMPVMNGYMAARKIRGLDREDACSVPILAMTADAFAEDIFAAKEAGMDGHIAKPLDMADLKLKISRFI